MEKATSVIFSVLKRYPFQNQVACRIRHCHVSGVTGRGRETSQLQQEDVHTVYIFMG